jgi:hypothetical protein
VGVIELKTSDGGDRLMLLEHPAKVESFQVFPGELREELNRYFTDHPDLCASSVEALACYIYNQKCVVQEVVHPAGEVEVLGPQQPDLQLAGFDPVRLMIQAKVWFDQVSAELQQIGGDWQSWMIGVFGCVDRDERTNETRNWTVQAFQIGKLSTWSLQVEGELGTRSRSQTFSVLSDPRETDSAGGGSLREEESLLKSYLVFNQRTQRTLQLLKHLYGLGLRSVQEYGTWCMNHGLARTVLKTVQQRRQELDLVGEDGEAAVSSGSERFRASVLRICDNDAEEEDLRTEYLKKIHSAFAGGLAGGARRAFTELLLHIEQHANLFSTRTAIPSVGPRTGNTFVEALAELARCHRSWILPLSEWKPDVYNPLLQFSSLLRHLVVRYSVPTFMDVAWFHGRGKRGQKHREWFLHIAQGQNIRTAEIPVSYTKSMAHNFLLAPGNYSIEFALRWGQIIGQGGNQEIVEAINETFLGESFENEMFWSTVIKFLVNQSMLDPDCIGPIIDFIYNQKYVQREVYKPGGGKQMQPPVEPNFSVKGRSFEKLLDQMEEWHASLAEDQKIPKVRWRKSPVKNFSYDEPDEEEGGCLHWTISELLNREEMAAEGRKLHHCVASYAAKCKAGKSSVWSLQVRIQNRRIRLATIAIDPRNKRVTQLRGKFNYRPSTYGGSKKQQSRMDEEYMKYMNKAGDVLDMWVRKEGLGCSNGDLLSWIY